MLDFSARMTGPISPVALVDKLSPASNTSTRLSLNSTSSNIKSSDSSGKLLHTQTIPENSATEFVPSETMNRISSGPLVFSPSESRYVEASPLPMTPGGALSTASARSALATKAAISALRSSSLPINVETLAENLHIPEDKRADTLDPKILDHDNSINSTEDKFVLRQEAHGASNLPAVLDDDGVWRKDTLPTAAERNAKLEKMSDE